MNKLGLFFLLTIFCYGQVAMAFSKEYKNDFKPAAMPKMEPLEAQPRSKIDQYIEKFSTKVAPGVISNMVGGAVTGFVIKAADKLEEMKTEKPHAQ